MDTLHMHQDLDRKIFLMVTLVLCLSFRLQFMPPHSKVLLAVVDGIGVIFEVFLGDVVTQMLHHLISLHDFSQISLAPMKAASSLVKVLVGAGIWLGNVFASWNSRNSHEMAVRASFISLSRVSTSRRAVSS